MAGKKYNQKGRNRSFRFAALEHSLMASSSYRALTTNARALLLELVIMYNGKNNGELYLGVRDAADRMGVTDTKVATAAFRELQDMGFIAEVEKGHFAVKAGDKRATCWRLTWHAVSGQHGPTNEYKDRSPEPASKAHRRMEKGLRVWQKWSRENQIPVGKLPTVFPKTVGDFPTNTPDIGNERDASVGNSPTVKRGNPLVSVDQQCGGFPYTYILPSTQELKGRRSKHVAPGPAADVFMGLDELREWVLQAIIGLPGAQTRLGVEAKISKGTLSKFLGGAKLSRDHRISVQQALPRVVAAMRTNSAGNGAG